jgi:hypothetical protein
MMIERKRGCGFRKIGAMYLIGSGLTVPCDRLPYKLDYCPTCGSGIHFQRAVQWVDWLMYAGMHLIGFLKKDCGCNKLCPICHPEDEKKYAVMWVGAKYYTTQSFVDEAQKLGVCKRIATVPKGVKLGETWILLAHKKAVTTSTEPEPGVFYAFRPLKIEKIVSMTQAKHKKKMKALQERGISVLVAIRIDEEGNARVTVPYEVWLDDNQ